MPATASKPKDAVHERTAARREAERELQRIEQQADQASSEVRSELDRRTHRLGGYPEKRPTEADGEFRDRCQTFEQGFDQARRDARHAMDTARQARQDAHDQLTEQVRALAFGDVDDDARRAAETITDKVMFNMQLRRLHRAGDKRAATAFAAVAWERRWDTLAASVVDAKTLVLLDILQADTPPPGVSRWVIR
jgi:hypothetical protein